MSITLTHTPPRSGSVVLPTPRRGSRTIVTMPTQRRAADSTGTRYVYGKTAAGWLKIGMLWDRLTNAQLQPLLTMRSTAGCGYDITIIDEAGISHTVRFVNAPISYQQLGPDRWSAGFEIEERIWAVLIDENGTTLLDENGNTITW